MANEIKVAYITGRTCTARVVSPDGIVRQDAIPLTEIDTGFVYLGTCETIEPGDIIILFDSGNFAGSSEYRAFDVTAAEAAEEAAAEEGLEGVGLTWTLAQIRSKIRKLAGIPDTSQMASSVITDRINDFYRNRFPLEIEDQHLNGWYERTLLPTDSGDYDLTDTVLEFSKPAFIDEDIVPIYQDSDRFFIDYPRIDTGAAYCITMPALAIGTDTKKVANSAFSYRTNDREYTFQKSAAETALSGSTIPQSKYGAFRLEIDSNGVIHIVEAADNSIGYLTAGDAMEGLGEESDQNACMGFVVVYNNSGTFIPGTTALNASGMTVTFTDGFVSSRNIPEAVLIEDGILYVRPKPYDIFSFRIYAKQKPSALVEETDTPLCIDWGPLIATGTAIEIAVDLGFNEEKVNKLKSLYDYQKMLLERRFAAQTFSGAQRAETAF